MKLKNLRILEGDFSGFTKRTRGVVVVFSPICPDYHFREVAGFGDKRERVHDFDGMGEGTGIVYLKLMKRAVGLFETLDKRRVDYKHFLLVADVERRDEMILGKLGIGRGEFQRRCEVTTEKINQDLRLRGFKKSGCFLMGRFFEKEGYPFFENIGELKERILKTGDRDILALVKKAQARRLPLHKFWFGISREKSFERTIEEMAMYASFGHCPAVDKGIVLCADSEVLSRCYNLFKKRKTPVVYLSGSY